MIVYCDQCPKCRTSDIGYTDWSDYEFLWVTYYCHDCHHRRREKIDLVN